MTRPRPTNERRGIAGIAGVVLTLLGIGLWGLYRVQAGSEAHSFTPGSSPPGLVHVTSGKQYTIAIPGGVDKEQALGFSADSLTCTVARPGSASRTLGLTAEDAGSKATNQIGSFYATFTGDAHVTCSGLPPVFVDSADGADGDRSGLWLVLTSVSLAIGLPLLLSVLRQPAFEPAEDALT